MRKWKLGITFICVISLMLGMTVCATDEKEITTDQVEIQDNVGEDKKSAVKEEGEKESDSEKKEDAQTKNDGEEEKNDKSKADNKENCQDDINEGSNIDKKDKLSEEKESRQDKSLSEEAYLRVGTIEVIKDGVVNIDLPDSLSYDVDSNTLTLNNYKGVVTQKDGETYATGVSFNWAIKEGFRINLVGENVITVKGKDASGISGDLTLEGTGSLTLNLIGKNSGEGIHFDKELKIKSCTLNINGQWEGEDDNAGFYSGSFYGINCWYEPEVIIEDANVNIQSTVNKSNSNMYNVGLDTQNGNLTVKNSTVNVDMKGGIAFSIGVGHYNYEDGSVDGGKFTLENSTIKCSTVSKDTNNLYFYNLNDLGKSYFYAGDESADTLRSFDEVFDKRETMSNQYRGKYNHIIISPKLITELCKHQWDEGRVAQEATCMAEGNKTYTCKLCGETKNETIPKLAHQFDEGQVTKGASCTEAGERKYTCTVCGETKVEEIPAQGHKFDEGQVTKEASCAETGEKKYTCTVCGESQTEEIPMTDHVFGEGKVIKEANCTETGEIVSTCSICGRIKTEVVPASGHKYNEGAVVKEATVSEEGEKVFTCTVCGATKTEKIAKLTGENKKPGTSDLSNTASNNPTDKKNPSTTTAVRSPQTADENQILVLVMLMAVSCGTIMTIMRQKRFNRCFK